MGAKEETREELLARAANERESRKLAREQLRAVITLQKHFRSWLTCQKARKEIGEAYDLQFSTNSESLNAFQLHRFLLRPLFFLTKPLTISSNPHKKIIAKYLQRNVSRFRVAIGILMKDMHMNFLAIASEDSHLFIRDSIMLARVATSLIYVTQNNQERDFLLEIGTAKFFCDLFDGKWDAQVQALTLDVMRNLDKVIYQMVKYIIEEHQQRSRKLVDQYCSRILMQFIDKNGSSQKQNAVDLMIHIISISQLKINAAKLFNEIKQRKIVENISKYEDILSDELQPRDKCAMIYNLVDLAEGSGLCIVKCLKVVIQSLLEGNNVDCVEWKGVLRSTLDQKLSRKFLSEAKLNDDFLMVIDFYGMMISFEEEMRSNSSDSKSSIPIFSALAFTPGTLKRMWQWLVDNLHVPKEAPLEATIGWNVESLKKGLENIEPEKKRLLSIFCNCYNCMLMVLDDVDFYKEQKPFKLTEQRAIATTMNCIVCNSILHSSTTDSRSEDCKLLSDVAMTCRLLYERDVKEEFCPPELWLGPTRESSKNSTLVITPSLARQILADTKNSNNAIVQLLKVQPHCYSSKERIQLLREVIIQDREIGRWNLAPAFGGMPPLRMTIRRGYILEDALHHFNSAGSKAKGNIEITFVNAAGSVEAGLDHGGLLKEFLEEAAKKGFDPNTGLFKSTDEGLLFPSAIAEQLDHGLALLHLLGMVIGKCIYEGILVDFSFANFFIAHILGQSPQLEDLRSYDKELYQNILNVKQYEGNAEDLGLYFAIESDFFGKHVVNELLPGGQQLLVTDSNKSLYVHLVANWYLNKQSTSSYSAFISGLTKILQVSWLQMFSPRDINYLVSGEHQEIDIDDLKMHTRYVGGYDANSPTIKIFWKVLQNMESNDVRAVIKFVTSCSRPPLLGFVHLNPPFTIQKVKCKASMLASIGLSADVDRLPTSATCFNTLKLPNFKRSSTLREKLLYAVRSAAGFELT